jgi:hypothetical protein
VTQNGLRLVLEVWPYESLVQISLRRDGEDQRLLALTFLVQGPVCRRKEKWGEYLEFSGCTLVSERYFQEQHDERWRSYGLFVQLFTSPDFKIEVSA